MSDLAKWQIAAPVLARLAAIADQYDAHERNSRFVGIDLGQCRSARLALCIAQAAEDEQVTRIIDEAVEAARQEVFSNARQPERSLT